MNEPRRVPSRRERPKIPMVFAIDQAICWCLDNRYPVIWKKQHMIPAILKKTECSLEFAAPDSFAIARGAACYYLNKLFSIPNIEDYEGNFAVPNWDTAFQTVENAQKLSDYFLKN